MANGYYRIELDYCLDIDEVAELMIAVSGGWMNSFQPKETDGRVGSAHYSAHHWIGEVKMSGTGSGPGSQVLIGITDYEYFGHKNDHNGRRVGHRHFWARGPHSAVLRVVYFFKAAIPRTLWRDVQISEDERRMWDKVEAGTIIPKITVKEAQTQALLLVARPRELHGHWFQ